MSIARSDFRPKVRLVQCICCVCSCWLHNRLDLLPMASDQQTAYMHQSCSERSANGLVRFLCLCTCFGLQHDTMQEMHVACPGH